MTIAKEEWELSRLQALKEEEERRAELEEDEMLYTYTRDDASNQVKKKRGRPGGSPMSAAAVAKRVQSRAAAYAASQEVYTDRVAGGRAGKLRKGRRPSVESNESAKSDVVAPELQPAKAKVGGTAAGRRPGSEKGDEFKENEVSKPTEVKKPSPAKVKITMPNKNVPPVLQPWSNPNLVIRTRRASSAVGESDSDIDVTTVPRAQREPSPVRHSVVTPSKIRQRERENIFAALSPTKILGPDATLQNPEPILEKMAAQLGTVNPKTGLQTPTTQIVMLRNAQGQTVYTSPSAAAALLRSQGSQLLTTASTQPSTQGTATATKSQNVPQMLLQGSTLVRNQHGQTLLVPRHLLPSVLQSQGKVVGTPGQSAAAPVTNQLRMTTVAGKAAAGVRVSTPAGGGVRPAVVAQGLQTLQGKLNPALVQKQTVRQPVTSGVSVASTQAKATLVQMPTIAAGSTITLQPGQLITAQQLQMLQQQTGGRARIVTPAGSTVQKQPSPVQVVRPPPPGQGVLTRHTLPSGHAVIQRLPAGAPILQKVATPGQPALLSLPAGTPISKLMQVQSLQKRTWTGQPVVLSSPTASSTPAAAGVRTPGSGDSNEAIVLSDDDDSPPRTLSRNIFEKISALSPARAVSTPTTVTTPRKQLGNIFEQMARPGTSSSGLSTVISMVQGTSAARKAAREPQIVTGNVQNVLHIPEQLHVDIPSPGSIPRNPNDSTETIGYGESDEDHISINSSDGEDKPEEKKPIRVPGEFREQLQQILQIKPQQVLKQKSPEAKVVLSASSSASKTSLPLILTSPSQRGATPVVSVKPAASGSVQYIQLATAGSSGSVQVKPVTTTATSQSQQVKILQVLKQQLDQPFFIQKSDAGKVVKTPSPVHQIPASPATQFVVRDPQKGTMVEQQGGEAATGTTDSRPARSALDQIISSASVSSGKPEKVSPVGIPAKPAPVANLAGFQGQFARFASKEPDSASGKAPVSMISAQGVNILQQVVRPGASQMQMKLVSKTVPTSTPGAPSTMRSILIAPPKETIVTTASGTSVGETVLMTQGQKPQLVPRQLIEQKVIFRPRVPGQKLVTATQPAVVRPAVQNVIIRPPAPTLQTVQQQQQQPPPLPPVDSPMIEKGDLPIDDDVIQALMSLKSPPQKPVDPLPTTLVAASEVASPVANQPVAFGELPADDVVVQQIPATEVVHVSDQPPTADLLVTEEASGVQMVDNSLEADDITPEAQEDQNESSVVFVPEEHTAEEVAEQVEVDAGGNATSILEEACDIVPGQGSEFPETCLETVVEGGLSTDNPTVEPDELDEMPQLEREDIPVEEIAEDMPELKREAVDVAATSGMKPAEVENGLSTEDGKETQEDLHMDNSPVPSRPTRSSRLGSVPPQQEDSGEGALLPPPVFRTRSRSRSQSIHSTESDESLEPPKKFLLTTSSSTRTVEALSTSKDAGSKQRPVRMTRRSIQGMERSEQGTGTTNTRNSVGDTGLPGVKNSDTPVVRRGRGRPRKCDKTPPEEQPKKVKRGPGRPRKSEVSAPGLDNTNLQSGANRASAKENSAADSNSDTESTRVVSARSSRRSSVSDEHARGRATRSGRTSAVQELKESVGEFENSKDPLGDDQSDSDDNEVSFRKRQTGTVADKTEPSEHEENSSTSPLLQHGSSPVNDRKGIFEQIAVSPTTAPIKRKSWRDEMDLECGHIVPTRDKGQAPYPSPAKVATNKTINSRNPASYKVRHTSGPRLQGARSPKIPKSSTPKTPLGPLVTLPAKRGRAASRDSDHSESELRSNSIDNSVQSKKRRDSNGSVSKTAVVELKKNIRGSAGSPGVNKLQKSISSESPKETRLAQGAQKRVTRSKSKS